MPYFLKKILPWFIPVFLLISGTPIPLFSSSFQGISTYYLRYTVKSSNHKITTDRLTMVPAEMEYRAENFSLAIVSQVIVADQSESPHTLESMAKKIMFARLLEQQGLKSITTRNQETIISYEGIVQTPVNLRIENYNEALGGYPCTAHIYFASISFPDKWESLRQTYKIKELINDFILFFK